MMIADAAASSAMLQSEAESRRDPTSLLLFLATAILLLQRFWLFAVVPWILPITALVLLAAYRRGAVAVDRQRVLAFLAFGGLAAMSAFIHGLMGDALSVKSLVYLLATYCMFVVIPAVPCDQLRLLRLWQAISLLCALLGILQFVLFLATQQVFDLSELLPPSIADNTGYNTIHIDPAGTFLRANGMLFLEPSFFSQFMALALVIEAAFLRNPYRLGCFVAALLCSMAGTGILMVVAALLVAAVLYPGILLRRRALTAVGVGALLILGVVVLVPTLQNYFAVRILEVFSPETQRTSFNVRFVAPWEAVYNLFKMGVVETLIGLGPGLFNVARLRLATEVTLNPITQMTVNYGIVATAAFAIFLVTVGFQRYSKAQWIVVLTVLVLYLFCSGSLLTPHVSCVLLWFALVFHPSRPTSVDPAA